MNQALVDAIAAAVLYEGYILYPYRPSVKNRQRWTFGGLCPESWCLTQQCGDHCDMQTECLVLGGEDVALSVQVRFLHLLDRTVGALAAPLPDLPQDGAPEFRAVESLRVGDRKYQSWQEAVEREVPLADLRLVELAGRPYRQEFAFPGGRKLEAVRGPGGEVVAVLVRRQWPISGAVEAAAAPAGDGLSRVTVRIVNQTSVAAARGMSRDEAMLHSLVSTHTILGVRAGEFVSLMDPPDRCREAAAGCRNVRAWPVLVGAAWERDTMLSSPIILHDYPQVAPESPGDLFDAAEIDEILTLRILTLTDEEKREVAAVDERARAMLERTEALAREQLMALHGTIRGLRPLPQQETDRG